MSNYKSNEVHRDFVKKVLNNVYSVAEGAVRAGKSVDVVVVSAMLIEMSPDRLHLFSGATEDVAKTVFGDCNGFGIEHIYEGRCRWTKWKNKTILELRKFKDNSIVRLHFAGGGKNGDFKAIRGRTIGMWFATEIDLHNEEFVKEALRRTGASNLRRIVFDMNPTYPNHYIYKTFDRWEKTGHFNYKKFMLFDNPSMTEEQIETFLLDYDKDSIFYRRDILGERLALKGSIYKNYDPNKILVDKCPFKPLAYYTGIDWGYSGSHTAMTLIATDFINVCVLYVEGEGEDRSSTDNIKMAKEFHKKIKGLAGEPVSYVDYADAGLTRDYNAMYPNSKRFAKLRILTRIRLIDKMMVNGNFTMIGATTKPLQESITSAIWNPTKENERLDDEKVYQVDYLDSLEYACHEVFLTMERSL